MKTDFKTYLTKRILEENGFFLTDQEIQVLAEGKFLDTVKNLGVGAAITAASLMPQTSKAAAVTPNFGEKPAAVSVSVPSRKTESKIDNFWKKQDSVYSPIRGNGVLVKSNTWARNYTKFSSIKQDNKSDDQFDKKIDFTAANASGPFQISKGQGTGLDFDEAIKDALDDAVTFKIGKYISAKEQMFVKSKTSFEKGKETRDSSNEFESAIKSNLEAIVGKFKVTKVETHSGSTYVEVTAEVQIRDGSNLKGTENFYRLDNQGKFRINKQTINY
jgi:hypothetical protein